MKDMQAFEAMKRARYRMDKRFRRPKWAVQQIYRETGLVEDVCEHGIGHPNQDWLDYYDKDGKKHFTVHGCDGCCSQESGF